MTGHIHTQSYIYIYVRIYVCTYMYAIHQSWRQSMRPSSSSPQWLCACWALGVPWTNFCFNWCIYAPCLVLVEHSVGSNTNNAWTPPLAVHSQHVAKKPLWWWGGWAHWILFMTPLHMYYAPCFVLAEHSVSWNYKMELTQVISIFSFRAEIEYNAVDNRYKKLKKHKNQSTSFLNCF